MSLTTQAALCQPGTTFSLRVRSACAHQVLQVLNEPWAATNHGVRLTLADRFMQDFGDSIAARVCLLVAADDDADDSTSDADLIARVAAIWDAAAGLATFLPVTLTTADSPLGTAVP